MSRRDTQSVTRGFDNVKSDYLAAKRDPRQRQRAGLPPLGSSADYHFRSERERLKIIEVVRDMERNDMLVGQGFDRAVDIGIGSGFKLDPKTGSEELNDALRARWTRWARNPERCDLAKEHTFHQLERLAYRSALRDGDMIAITTSTGALEMIEAHRCQTPQRTERNVIGGVRLDETTRERLEYWFTRVETDPHKQARLVKDIRRVPTRTNNGRRQVLHIYNPRRVSQTRGVSALVNGVTAASYHEDLNYAGLVKQQIATVFGLMRELPAGDFSEGETDGGPGDTSGTIDPSRPQIEPGMEYTGRPGEKLSMFESKVPNSEFFTQVRYMAEIIGLNLGLPLILLTMDASETNFSGWRGAFETAKYGFRANQDWLEHRFHRPIYTWLVGRWVRNDPELRALAEQEGVNLFDHDWKRPAWPYIEPFKDSQADNLRATAMLMPRRRLAAERGFEFDRMVDDMIEDNALLAETAIVAAQRLNKAHPDAEVNWRELIGVVANVSDADAQATMASPPVEQEQNGSNNRDE